MSVGALRLPGFCDGIDVSSVQRIDDPDAIYAAGFRFAFVKAAEGLTGRDPAYRRHVDALRGAGLYVGAYAYARVSQGDPAAQARHAYSAATDDGRHVVRLVLDLESAPAGWTARQLCEFAEDWFTEAERYGCLPVLYSYTNFLARMSCVALGGLLAHYHLWLAQYRSVTSPWAPASEADMPRAYPWAMWQYSGDKGHRVPGIVGDCDRNLIRAASVDELRAWFGLPPEGTTLDMGGPVHGHYLG